MVLCWYVVLFWVDVDVQCCNVDVVLFFVVAYGCLRRMKSCGCSNIIFLQKKSYIKTKLFGKGF